MEGVMHVPGWVLALPPLLPPRSPGLRGLSCSRIAADPFSTFLLLRLMGVDSRGLKPLFAGLYPQTRFSFTEVQLKHNS